MHEGQHDTREKGEKVRSTRGYGKKVQATRGGARREEKEQHTPSNLSNRDGVGWGTQVLKIVKPRVLPPGPKKNPIEHAAGCQKKKAAQEDRPFKKRGSGHLERRERQCQKKKNLTQRVCDERERDMRELKEISREFWKRDGLTTRIVRLGGGNPIETSLPGEKEGTPEAV